MKNLSDLNWWKQVSVLVGGFLSSLLGLLSWLNIHFKWFTSGTIDASVVGIVALGVFIVGMIATLKNTYLTKGSKDKAVEIAQTVYGIENALNAAIKEFLTKRQVQAQTEAQAPENPEKVAAQAAAQLSSQDAAQVATAQTAAQVAAATQDISVAPAQAAAPVQVDPAPALVVEDHEQKL
jgi:hypothetical protein